MGHFFAASAFQHESLQDLTSAITQYAQSRGVTCTPQDGKGTDERSDATLYEARGGWAVVIWPVYFNIHDVPVCAAVAKELDCLSATVNVYDGDFWSLEFIDKGGLLTQVAPRADYFAEDDESAEQLRAQWRGDPAALAARFGLSADQVRPYFAYVGHEDEPGKAFPDDEFPLEDFWVFVDFWRRLGITYPSDPEAYGARLRFAKNFSSKLPTWEGEPL